MTDEHTAESIARWMLDQLDRRRRLYQDSAMRNIRHMFGHEWSYENENGNLAIHKGVLAEFRKLGGDDVVWERGSRSWRKRTERDVPGHQQEG